MNELRDRLERELNQVPVAPRSASDVIAWADRRRRRHRIGTVALALVLTLGSIGLISRAFEGSGGTPFDGVVKAEERIVFNSIPWPDIPGQLYSVGVDGARLEQMTRPDADYLAPAVSPDGSKIAFVRFVRGSDPPQTFHEGIYVMSVEGSEMFELLTTGEPKPISVSQIAWSPDGSQIAFIREFFVGHSEADFQHELWIMNSDGSEPHKVVDRQIESFSWSPDGSRIAFTEQAVAGERFVWDLYVMDADGRSVERLTQDGQSRQPSWSPDGEKLAFQSHDQIYVMNADGSQISRLTIGQESYGGPAWSPDSSALAINAFDQESHRCSILTVTMEGDVATVLESHRPEPRLGGETEPSICAGTLAWEFLETGGGSAALESPNLTPRRAGESGYKLDNVRVIGDPTSMPQTNERVVDVSYDAAWADESGYPGRAVCRVEVLNITGTVVGSMDFEFGSYVTPVSQTIPVPINGTPVSAHMNCTRAVAPPQDANYILSDAAISLGGASDDPTRRPHLTFKADWTTDVPPLLRQCELTIALGGSEIRNYPFEISLGDGERGHVILPSAFQGATIVTVGCGGE